MRVKHLIITLDGPAGAGKSTVAKGLADRLGISYLDTGAMYRALTFKGLLKGIDLANEDQLVALAAQTKIDFIKTQDGSLQVTLDGENVEHQIRSVEVTNNTFYAARAPRVREILVGWQRQIGHHHSIVGDGRDLGTVVFPDADYKFYVDAKFDERVERRMRDLKAAGRTVDEAQLRADMADRDQKDLTRAAGPLRRAEDAVYIDSTGLSVDGTVDVIMKHIK